MKLAKFFVFSAMTLAAAAASATVHTVSYTGNRQSSATNWNDVFSLQRFDSHLGNLKKVNVDLYGDVSGSARYESLDASAADVAIDLGATIKLSTVSGQQLVTINPLVSKSYAATAFDGSIDFGGTSGKSLSGLAATSQDSASFDSTSWLALFTGPGSIDLNLAAKGASAATGPGNVISQFATNAGANYKVTYTYEVTPVPEPETYALMGLGLCALVLNRKRAK